MSEHEVCDQIQCALEAELDALRKEVDTEFEAKSDLICEVDRLRADMRMYQQGFQDQGARADRAEARLAAVIELCLDEMASAPNPNMHWRWDRVRAAATGNTDGD